MSFLTAEWNDLALFNYEIDPELLKEYVPIGTELDLWNDRCYISLIGFMFEEVKILGLKIPLHVNFEEVNLRFYVKRWKMEFGNVGLFLLKKLFRSVLFLLLQILCIKNIIKP
jgi:uncharacterized protein YqjF (DUF2071 family)